MESPAIPLAVILLGALLAGCSHPSVPVSATTDAPRADGMRIAGLVEADTLLPLAGANVTLLQLNLTVRTDDGGRFAFEPVVPRAYIVQASLPGFRVQQLVATPNTNEDALDFVLQRALPPKPYQTSFEFSGLIECGAEALIISGPCDAATQEAQAPAVFQNVSAFPFQLDRGWRTVVIDVVFDPTANRGIDGLRIAVRAPRSADSLGNYEQLGRFHGSKPFTARLEPGGNYTDATAPVDGNLTGMLIEAYPQGFAYHAACDPTGFDGRCFNGAGAGANIRFNLYVTVFYLDPAPPGFTLRTDA